MSMFVRMLIICALLALVVLAMLLVDRFVHSDQKNDDNGNKNHNEKL